MKTRANLKYFLNDFFWKHFLAYIVPDPFRLNLFDNFGNPKAFDIVLT